MPYQAPQAAKPCKQIFDPFNSSATGHQRADNRLSGSTSWRDSRSLKLREQFSSGAGGGKRVSDSVGAGALDFGQDGRTENGGWEKGAKGLRKGGQQSIWESMKVEKRDGERPAKRIKTEELTANPNTIVSPFTPYRKQDGTIRDSSWTSHELSPSDLLEPLESASAPRSSGPVTVKQDQDATQPPGYANGRPESPSFNDESQPKGPAALQIFANLTIYLNGCTAPLSDHKLKYLISTHGGNMSISLGRRTVTHVILGKINANGGCGGGLAGTKIQKEIASLRGKSVKFVTAEWIVDSIKAGKRLPESRYEAMKLAPKGVANISTMFKPTVK